MQRSNSEVEKFYNSKAWKEIREAYYNSQLGICERCGQAGFFVHHKKYITIDNIHDAEITLNWDNLELLCKKCHIQEHFKQEAEYSFDENGDMIYCGQSRKLKNKKKSI